MNLLFFSRLIGRAITDTQGGKIATLRDLIVRINPEAGKSEEKYPPLAGLLAYGSHREFWIPIKQVDGFGEDGIRLFTALVSLERFNRRDGEILLGQDVMDKQLVDVEGRRVIRVNDLALSRAPHESIWRLAAVDVSFQAIVRRIGPFTKQRILPKREVGRSEDLLDWADIEYFASSAPTVRLNVSHERLGKLHPADIGRLMDELSYVQGAEIINYLDDETAADALEEMTSDYAADILEGLDEDRAADILEEMQPDDAADVIADLDEIKANRLLNLMETEEQQDVRELLGYEEESAGGMMTNDFLMLPSNLTASQALRRVREMDVTPEFVDYIYVVEPESEKLVGVASLRNVVFNGNRDTLLTDLMQYEPMSVTTDAPAEQAAAVIAEYGLRAVPVLDEAGDIQGVITFDDALELILPEDVRRKVPRVFK